MGKRVYLFFVHTSSIHEVNLRKKKKKKKNKEKRVKKELN